MKSTPFLSFGALVVSLGACSSGSVPLGPQRPIERDPPYSSQDPPNASGTCVSCGENFRCTGTVQGVPVDVVYASVGAGSECSIEGSTLRVRCDGQIVGGDIGQETITGTWTPRPDGGYVACVGGDCLTCVPTTDPPTQHQQQPQPGGGAQADAG